MNNINKQHLVDPTDVNILENETELRPIPSDPHEILDVSVGASKDEIREAFRKRIFMYHPDRNNNSPYSSEWTRVLIDAQEQLLKEKSSSYETLSGSRPQNSEEREREFWKTNVRNVQENVWNENTTFWKGNERAMGTQVESRIITKDGLMIKHVNGIYKREYLVSPLTEEVISAEYQNIISRDGMIIGKRPSFEYLLDESGTQRSEGFLKIEKRGNNIVGWRDSFGKKIDRIMSVE